jgi:hypothetical protein
VDEVVALVRTIGSDLREARGVLQGGAPTGEAEAEAEAEGEGEAEPEGEAESDRDSGY